jgi:uncharacterized protein
MWYAIRGFDKTGSAELRRRTRPEHLARLVELRDQGRVLTAGPLTARDGPAGALPGSAAGSAAQAAHGSPEFVGSLMVLEFENLDAARSWADAEPYLTAGVFDRITVDPYLPTLP